MPSPVEKATDAVVYHGPASSEIDWPVGASVSGVTVNVAVLVRPAPSVTVAVCWPLAESDAVQE